MKSCEGIQEIPWQSGPTEGPFSLYLYVHWLMRKHCVFMSFISAFVIVYLALCFSQSTYFSYKASNNFHEYIHDGIAH